MKFHSDSILLLPGNNSFINLFMVGKILLRVQISHNRFNKILFQPFMIKISAFVNGYRTFVRNICHRFVTMINLIVVIWNERLKMFSGVLNSRQKCQACKFNSLSKVKYDACYARFYVTILLENSFLGCQGVGSHVGLNEWTGKWL